MPKGMICGGFAVTLVFLILFILFGLTGIVGGTLKTVLSIILLLLTIISCAVSVWMMKCYTVDELSSALKTAGFAEVRSDHYDGKPWITVIARK